MKLRDLGSSQLKAKKGKFRALVMMDSGFYQIDEDVETLSDAKRLVSNPKIGFSHPVAIVDEKGKHQNIQ